MRTGTVLFIIFIIFTLSPESFGKDIGAAVVAFNETILEDSLEIKCLEICHNTDAYDNDSNIVKACAAYLEENNLQCFTEKPNVDN